MRLHPMILLCVFLATLSLQALQAADFLSPEYGTGLDSSTYAVVVDGENVYVGGSFSHAGGVAAESIAMWDGSKWVPLGSGIKGRVDDLLFLNGKLYAVGDFTEAGGVAADCIAVWNGFQWSSLGTGPLFQTQTGTSRGSIVALATDGTNIFIGGGFTSINGVAANYVAKYDGQAWSQVGAGLTTSVNDIEYGGGMLYAAGQLISRFDGQTWTAIGLNVKVKTESLGTINGMAGYLSYNAGTLYAGGAFSEISGVAANGVAKFDGSTWSPVGTGINDTSFGVFGLLATGNELFVGGGFTMIGGIKSNNVGRFDGTAFVDIFGGVSGNVNGAVSTRAFAKTQDGVIIVGEYKKFGKTPANCIVKLVTNPLPQPLLSIAPNPANSGDTVAFSVDAGTSTVSWNFGDGGTATGAAVTHVYNSAGVYNVSAMLTGANGTVTSPTTLFINQSAPLAGTFDILKGAVSLSFKGGGKDSVSFSGVAPVPGDFVAKDSEVFFLFGNIIRNFKLDEKGSFNDGQNTLKFGTKAGETTAKFAVQLKKQSFSAPLRAQGFVNDDVTDASLTPTVGIIVNGNGYSENYAFKYSAKAGNSGKAK